MNEHTLPPLVSPAALQAARRKLEHMQEMGASYYRIGKTLGRPAGTVRAWCLGGGIKADDVETILNRKVVVYQYLGKRTRTRYGRPCIPWAQYVLIRMEAQRRGITPADLICDALGITDGEADR